MALRHPTTRSYPHKRTGLSTWLSTKWLPKVVASILGVALKTASCKTAPSTAPGRWLLRARTALLFPTTPGASIESTGTRSKGTAGRFRSTQFCVSYGIKNLYRPTRYSTTMARRPGTGSRAPGVKIQELGKRLIPKQSAKLRFAKPAGQAGAFPQSTAMVTRCVSDHPSRVRFYGLMVSYPSRAACPSMRPEDQAHASGDAAG